MLYTVHSNRLEALAGRLITDLVTPTPGRVVDPLCPEIMLVQHPGMAHWLSLRIADQLGIAANLNFTYPASFVWRLFEAQWPDLPKTSAYDRDALLWRLYGLLPEFAAQPGESELARYIGQQDPLKTYQLAARLAELYDQYLVYRPEWLIAWEHDQQNGLAADWQARLWQTVVARTGQTHRGQLFERFAELCRHGRPNLQGLPSRLSVFGISTLAPAYFGVLERLSKWLDVRIYVLNPCREYWGDVEDERRLARRRQLSRDRNSSDQEGYFTVGHSLLASWGRQGRDWVDLLLEGEGVDEEQFEEPPTEHVLGRLQSDILNLQSAAWPAWAAADNSLQIHDCHGPMREVQVLHDRLLALFEQHRDLTPRDVVVMAPNMDNYAPYVQAVFATQSQALIPWSIADLPRCAEHPILPAFLSVLALPDSQLTASEVLGLLELPAIQRCWGLDESAYEQIRQAIIASGVRWAWDAKDRQQQGLPENDMHTWHFGKARLLLGYAMGDEESLPFAGVMPLALSSSTDSPALGQVLDFVDRLRALKAQLSQPQSPPVWLAVAEDIFGLFAPETPEENTAIATLRQTLQAFMTETTAAGFTADVPHSVFYQHVRQALDSPGGERRFLTGAVTFCKLQPMRSLPFRVVCLLGMNEGDFPRQHRPPSFDLMASRPRRGDRNRRDEDRQLFLEALLSAKDVLYISYQGRDIRDNSARLPSVLVSELLEVLERSYGPDTRRRVLTEHPLQVYSPRYGADDPQLFSYASVWLQTRVATPELPFAAKSLPMPDATTNVLDVDSLHRFLRNPAEHFLRERLGVRLTEYQDLTEDTEPFSFDALENYRVKDHVLTGLLRGDSLESAQDRLHASARLPHGQLGHVKFAATVDALPDFAARLRLILGEPQPDRELDLMIGDVRLVGKITGLTTHGLVRYRSGKLKAKYALGLWLDHLLLNLLEPQAHWRSAYYAQDEEWHFSAVEDAVVPLQMLLDLYRRNLERPLPFFPQTSLAYAQALIKDNDEAKAIKAAHAVWNSNDRNRGEREDPYYRVAFRGVEPLTSPEFADLALAIYRPYLRAREVNKSPEGP